MEINAQNINFESVVNEMATHLTQGDLENKKISKAEVVIHKEHLKDKREERIQNLTDQLKGASQGGGCFKVLKVVFKVVDLLMKPLSAITMNQLKTNLSQTLDALKEAKNQKRILGLNIKEQDILKALEGLKKLLNEDTDRLKTQENQSDQDVQTILRILDDIQSTFQTIQTKTN